MTTKAKKKYGGGRRANIFSNRKKLRFFLVQPNKIKEIIIMLTFFWKRNFCTMEKNGNFPAKREKSADAFFVKNLRFTEYTNKFWPSKNYEKNSGKCCGPKNGQKKVGIFGKISKPKWVFYNFRTIFVVSFFV